MNFESYIFTGMLATVSYIGIRSFIWLYNYFKSVKMINKIKGPPMIPFIGNTQIDLNKNIFLQMVEISKKYKDEACFYYWFGPTPSVYFHKVDYLDTFLSQSKYIEKPFGYDFLKPWLKEGLLMSSGEKWHNRRKLITPTFHFDILKDYMPVMNEQTDILINILTRKCKTGEPINVTHTMSMATLDIICETAMGVQIDAQTNEKNEYVRACLDISKLVVDRLFYIPYWPNFIYNRTEAGKKHNKCLEVIHSFTRKVIKERSEDYETNNAYVASNKKNRTAFLDMLLKVKNEYKTLSFDDIQEEVDTFMFAGHDTTAASLSWTLQLIGTYPSVQKKIHEEVDSLLGSSNTSLTNENLGNLKYLDCVIKESLRLYPSAPIFSRLITEEVEIDNYKLPKGTEAKIFSYMIHRNENYFKNAEEFIPERFLPENSVDRHPFAYIPFSAGKRNCIGQRFAQIEEKIILANIMRKFEIKSLKTIEEIQPFSDIILRPTNPILVELKLRNLD